MTGFTAMAMFGVAFVIMTVGQLILARRLGVTSPEKIHRLPNERVFRLGAIAAMSLGTVFYPSRVPLAMTVIGACTMGAGMGLLVWAQVTLGRNWVPGIGVHRGHKLVTAGPYAWIRHPIYTAIGVFMVGGAVYCANIFFLIAAILMWLGLAIRVPFEEGLMGKKFKKRWTAYESTTGAFLPRLRR